MSLTPSDRVRLFDLLHFYVRDTTFVAHAHNIDLNSPKSIAINCELLRGTSQDSATRLIGGSRRVWNHDT